MSDSEDPLTRAATVRPVQSSSLFASEKREIDAGEILEEEGDEKGSNIGVTNVSSLSWDCFTNVKAYE